MSSIPNEEDLVALMTAVAHDFDVDALGMGNLDRLMTDALRAIRHLLKPAVLDPSRRQFIVVNDKHGYRRHGSLKRARTEAERLHEKTGEPFLILKLKDGVTEKSRQS